MLLLIAILMFTKTVGTSQDVASQIRVRPEPNLQLQNALIVSELAIKQNGFDPTKWYVSSATWVTISDIPKYDIPQIQKLFEDFGPAPFWHFTIELKGWKPADGGYGRPMNAVFVYDQRRAAVIEIFSANGN